MPTDYDKIREDNIREYGEGTRHLAFLGRLYTDRTHFIFELLQNAEDAGASSVSFHLFDDRLEVTHDGRPFNVKDVKGVCGVGEGSKAEDLTKIGKFGIGFKSVYAYTATPEVHSDSESFKIENYVRPHAVPSKPIKKPLTTLFVFPFNHEEISPETACQEIGTRLSHLNVQTLLFLRKIKNIDYTLPDKKSGTYLREESLKNDARQVIVIGENNDKEEEETWLIFERSVAVPEKLETVRVEIAFQWAAADNAKKTPERVIKIKESPLVVYFPTEKETRLGFLIQGPYRTTPSRDNIPKDDEWNKTLIRETAALIKDTLPKIKKMGLLSVSFLEALPIKSDDFPKDSMFYLIAESVKNIFIAEELLPTDDGSFVAAKNAKLVRGADLIKLLNQQQLCQLFATESLQWLSGAITQDRTPDLRSYLIEVLRIEEVAPEGFARKINESFLSKQPDDWFIRFYSYLSGQEALWKKPRWQGDSDGILRLKPILRLDKGGQAIPFGSDGITPKAFLPPPEGTDFPIVKRSIANDKQAQDFLKRLGLSEPDLFDEVVGKVFQKYTKANKTISNEEHHADIQKISRALSADSESGKKKVIDAATQTPFLKATDLSGGIHFKKPDEIYANTPELQRYFSKVQEALFLHNEYANPEIWYELGVSNLPRKLETSEGFHGKHEYSTRERTIKNYDLDGLEAFLEAIQEITNFEDQKQSAIILWGFLKNHLEQDPRFFIATYHWFYWRPEQRSFYAMMLERLKAENWIPTKEGTLAKPCEINTGQIIPEFSGAMELIKALGIAEDIDQTALDHKRELAAGLGISLEDAEVIKNNPEAFQRWKETEMAARKAQPIFPSRPVNNPERREEHLAEEIADAPDKTYEKRETSVRTSRGDIDPTTWLRNQYTNENGEMVCQLCKKEMPFKKRDGQYYFEAVEILRDDLPKEHEAQFLALCPLCAAKYKEFVKNVPDAIAALKEAIINTTMTDKENIEIPIALGNEKTSIRFVETHIFDFKKILENLTLKNQEKVNGRHDID